MAVPFLPVGARGRSAALALLLSAAPARAASPPPVSALHGMVVSADVTASAVGVEVLRRGGNAVDAAIATELALAVTFPEAGNLAGGGFLLLRRKDGSAEALDFRETAPRGARRELYLDPHGRPDPGR